MIYMFLFFFSCPYILVSAPLCRCDSVSNSPSTWPALLPPAAWVGPFKHLFHWYWDRSFSKQPTLYDQCFRLEPWGYLVSHSGHTQHLPTLLFTALYSSYLCICLSPPTRLYAPCGQGLCLSYLCIFHGT